MYVEKLPGQSFLNCGIFLLYWTAPAQEHVAIIYWEIGISISKRVIVSRHVAVLNVANKYNTSTA